MPSRERLTNIQNFMPKVKYFANFFRLFRNFSYEHTNKLRTRYYMTKLYYLEIFVIRKKIFIIFIY